VNDAAADSRGERHGQGCAIAPPIHATTTEGPSSTWPPHADADKHRPTLASEEGHTPPTLDISNTYPAAITCIMPRSTRSRK
jgi:hypothetical protein